MVDVGVWAEQVWVAWVVWGVVRVVHVFRWEVGSIEFLDGCRVVHF